MKKLYKNFNFKHETIESMIDFCTCYTCPCTTDCTTIANNTNVPKAVMTISVIDLLAS
jgi:putative bacteriocin precursor